MQRVLPILALTLACSREAPVERVGVSDGEGVVAEVHLHQYAQGSHAAAGFIDDGVPFRPELDEQLVHFAVRPVAEEGGCRLHVPSVCAPACDGARAYCESERCVEYTPLSFRDAGPVRVTGSSVISAIELTFDPRIPGYRSGRSSAAPLFAPGDPLIIHGPSGRYAFRAEVVAPKVPELSSPFAPTGDAALRVLWSPAEGEIIARMVVSTRTGHSATVTCFKEVDDGEVVVPRALMSALPPAPRTLQLEIARVARRVLPLPTPGQVAVITVASTAVVERTE